MFVDKAEIFLRSGKGGDGFVSFRREKYVPDGGPDGGDGGKGASVIAIVDEGLRTLMDFRYKTKYIADDGQNGGKSRCTGKDAQDLYIKVPPGTIIRDKETGGIIADLTEKGEQFVIAKGGKGGRGNWHFKTSVRQAPSFSEQGKKGVERSIVLELKMLADVGLVGYPNVGKSTILSTITKAKPKIANYHFTTLQPNLGVVEVVRGKSFVLADIPGLIDGAHQGIGLGHEFLRHVERTRVIVHVVDVSGLEGRDPIQDFDQINSELRLYNEKLADRYQIVAANKMDLIFEDDQYETFKNEMETRGYKVFPISAATGKGVNELMQHVTEMLDEVEAEPLYSDDDFFVELEKGPAEIHYSMEGEIYVVTGEPVERLVYATNFDDDESLRHFQSVLMQKGVFEKLKEMGIDDGDTVRVEDVEFEFYD